MARNKTKTTNPEPDWLAEVRESYWLCDDEDQLKMANTFVDKALAVIAADDEIFRAIETHDESQFEDEDQAEASYQSILELVAQRRKARRGVTP